MPLNFGPARSTQDTGGAVHDAVVREHHVHLRIVIVGLRLGQDVLRRAGDHHHLDVVGLLERVEHMPGLGFFQGPAVHADVQRLGPRNGQAAGQAGSRITHIAKATGLTQATTRRLLQSLVAKRIVEQDASFRLYRLSIDFFLWPRRLETPWICARCAALPCFGCVAGPRRRPVPDPFLHRRHWGQGGAGRELGQPGLPLVTPEHRQAADGGGTAQA